MFHQLTSLETFCSVGDDFFLDTYFGHPLEVFHEPPVFSKWPNLRTVEAHTDGGYDAAVFEIS